MIGFLTFRGLDVVVILVFLLAMAGMGVFFSKKNKSTEDYFLGGRSFPGWAIGLSMIGTSLSSVTFLALPAAAYVLDMRFCSQYLLFPFILIVSLVVFIPFFRRAKITSAFEYLESRFGRVVRGYAALSFIVLQVIRLSTVLYLVSVPVAQLSGQPSLLVILVGGIIISFYTVLGGIEAVIWTDVVQTLILIGGGVLCFVMILIELPGGLGEVIRVGVADHKISLGPTEWSLNERTMWVMMFVGGLGFLGASCADQNVVQRYLAAKSMREARKASSICVGVSLLTWWFFIFLGVCLYVYFKAVPDAAVADMSPEDILPFFILTRVPAGIAGLIIAAVLAAAMSSLDSSINSVTTVATVDFLKPYFAKARSEEYYLKWAKGCSLLVGVVMIGGAMVFHYIPRESMNDLAMILASLFGGCTMGLFLVGFFSMRVDNVGAVSGLVASVLFNLYLLFNAFGWLPEALEWHVHSYLAGALVNLLFFITAYLIALLRPGCQTKDLSGLTVWTVNKES